jgi:hypothetical protein
VRTNDIDDLKQQDVARRAVLRQYSDQFAKSPNAEAQQTREDVHRPMTLIVAASVRAETNGQNTVGCQTSSFVANRSSASEDRGHRWFGSLCRRQGDFERQGPIWRCTF